MKFSLKIQDEVKRILLECHKSHKWYLYKDKHRKQLKDIVTLMIYNGKVQKCNYKKFNSIFNKVTLLSVNPVNGQILDKQDMTLVVTKNYRDVVVVANIDNQYEKNGDEFNSGDGFARLALGIKRIGPVHKKALCAGKRKW